CVGDGEADNIPADAITLSGNSSTNEAWVVTDDQGNILGLPATPYDVNFDEAPAGTCLVWHLGYEDNVSFDGVTNASELMGCYALSNPITVNRYAQPTAGVLEGGPFEFCVGDGEADNIPADAITLSGNSSTNEAWVVTDDQGNILGLPATPYDVNFDEAPAGTCLVWHLGYEDNVSFDGVTNASELMGCYALSNPITVTRKHTEGGTISGGEDNTFTFTVGDGEADIIPEDSITLSDNVGTNSQWVITDEDGIILALPDSPYDVNFDEAPAGNCLIWHLSYEDGLEGAEVDGNAADLVGCYSLSNSIIVVRNAASSRIAIYPNPTKGDVTIDLKDFGSRDVRISIFNLQQIRLFDQQYNRRSLLNDKANLNVSNYLDGVYFVQIIDNRTGNKFIKRFVVSSEN
ncbi:T9SS type A sorting domain-containing protein, partial [Flavobacteriaceae bacterium MJ-SS4]|uniref:T9SS type A sorting domain-containing protein n=1 Tax=Gilvirhabdus luticola TaxID=3079858 RepID=UPI0032DE0F77